MYNIMLRYYGLGMVVKADVHCAAEQTNKTSTLQLPPVEFDIPPLPIIDIYVLIYVGAV